MAKYIINEKWHAKKKVNIEDEVFYWNILFFTGMATAAICMHGAVLIILINFVYQWVFMYFVAVLMAESYGA